MALLRNISICLSAETSGFTASMAGATRDLDRLNAALLQTQSNVGALDLARVRTASAPGGISAPSGQAKGGGLDSSAAAMIASSLAPLSQIGGKISAQINTLGGTFTTLARRLDNAIKFPQTKAALEDVEKRLKTRVGAAAGVATADLTRLQRVTLALGPAALRAIDGFKGFNSVSTLINNFTRRGDVAKKSLDQLARIKFDGPSASASRLGTSLASISPTANRAAVAVKGLGLQIGLALGAVGLIYKGTQALVGFFSEGIKGAMNLGETVSKTKEVFGDATGSVVKQAEEMAAAFGLAKGPMLDAASNIGLIAAGAGKSKGESAELANTLSRLAADAASFYNVPMDTALEKIRAGLVGESEPLRAFGVLLSETAVKAEAQALGLGKGAKGIDDAAKVTARASLIVKGLQTASGDLARTQDSAANQFRKTGGGIQNFATTIGGVLLPAVQSGIGAFNELLATLVETFESNRAVIEGWAGNVKASIDLVGVVIRNFGDFWEIAKLSTIEKISNILAYIDTIPGDLAIIAEYISGNWKDLIADAFAALGTYVQNLATNYANLFVAIQGFFKGEGWNFDFTPMLTGFEATAAKLPEMLKPQLISMQAEIDAVGERIAGRETARAATIQTGAALAKPTLPGAAKEVEGGDQYHAAAASELGSREANSAIARFLNGSSDEPAKETSRNTKELVELQRQTLEYMKRAKESGNEVGLAIAAL